MASRTLISKLYPLISTLPSSISPLARSPSLLRLRPLAAAACGALLFGRRSPAASTSVRCFSSRPTISSLNDPSPNFSNRPPKETILLDGCDFEHWLVVMDPPEPDTTRDDIIDYYIKTLAQIVGSEEEARMKIYSVSTKHYFAFGALVSEELSYKIKNLPKVRWVLPDSYLDVKNKDYGGEPFIDGKAVPYDPKYHEEWVRNNARANERSRRSDRPRNVDRSRNFERRRDAGPPMPNQDFQRGPNPMMAQNTALPTPPPNRDFNQMPPRENPNMGAGMPNRNTPPPPPPPQYQSSTPNPGYQGSGYPQQGGAQGYPGSAPAYQGGSQGGYQGGNYGASNYQGGSGPSYQGSGSPPYQGGGGGNPSYQGGAPAYQGGAPPYQGGAPPYQGGGSGGNPSYQNYQGGNPSNYQPGGYPGGGPGSNYQTGGSAYQGGAPDHQVRDLPGRDH